MTARGTRGLSRLLCRFLARVAFLVVLSLPIFVTYAEEGGATGQQILSQQQRKTISVQEGFRATGIINAVVKNDRGHEVGEIDDLMMSRNGKVKKVILSVGGFKVTRIGEKLAAIPFRPLMSTDLGFVYNITIQQLKNLPEFNYKNK